MQTYSPRPVTWVNRTIDIIVRVSLVCFSGIAFLHLALAAVDAQAQEHSSQAPVELEAEGSVYLRRDLSALKTILNDNVPVWTPQTVGLTADDGPFLYEALARLQEIDPYDLASRRREFLNERKADPEVRQPFSVFVDLFHHPELYQGEPVQMTGHSQRVVAIPGAEFVPNCNQLYEVWLYPEDGLTNPAVVITTSLPDGVSVGDQLINGLTVNGIFLKRYTYRAADAMRFAPLIVTNTLTRRVDSVASEGTQAMQLMIGIGIVALLGIVMGIVLTKLGKTQKRVQSTAEHLELPEMPDSEQ